MAGGGANDSPALAVVHVGIAIGNSASALAVESAGMTLKSNDLLKLLDLFKLGRLCKQIICENIIGSILIKLIFASVSLAVNGLLWLAVLSDVFGLIFVTINGL